MNKTIDIKGLDKAEVLAALYNASKQQGMGFFHSRGGSDMTVEEAQKEIELGDDHQRKYPEIIGKPDSSMYFDYLHGRVMKVAIGKDELDPYGYDRDNGPGAALRALAPLIAKLG